MTIAWKGDGETTLTDSFRDRLRHQNMSPLWDVFKDLVAKEPNSGCQPTLWRYAEARHAVLEAGEIISASDAERRVLVLENPGLKGQSRITTSLYAGLQLVLPGENAPAHRHSQSALRLVIEGDGGYTTVDGERVPMAPGDFIITPTGSWHDHGNDGSEPVIWLDGLDIPMIGLFDASFVEHHPTQLQSVTRPPGDALARYGSGLLPTNHQVSGSHSPLFHYPYTRTIDALERLRGDNEIEPGAGVRFVFVNPATGGPAMPGIEAFVQGLEGKSITQRYRATDATVFSVISGQGRVHFDDRVFEWRDHDTFVVPSWCRYQLEAHNESVLFGFSDRPLQRYLGVLKEERS